MTEPTYEIHAVRYATQARMAWQNFLFTDDHASSMPIDFYVWAVVGNGRTIVVDAGFDEATAERRRRPLLRTVPEALALAGVDAATVPEVVLTHLHNDHAGAMAAFPKARFHVQDAEMAFATGRCMCHAALRLPFEAEHVVDAVRHLFAGRLDFHDGAKEGPAEIAPGITLHLVGGHSGGMQVVRVPTARGWVVLASDATHYWANIRERRPFPIVADLGAMMEGFRTCEALADGPDHIIPGHDPEVLRRFPRSGDSPDAVRVDLPPLD
ncbi:N-acyl homoserine lactonase family protein [Roseomonas sp. NAR14]|uniref:N-acyl homoserine lactonase family protein n=1 Tax=Roseomonas acroporae TaxID=2937791 RepID=A0A9X2BWS4_9PROT|nr:N-acyl homoserine lactonase family protein [Roseomonas acroporae]MCK8784200.1 N-acyl homoserine lactonase family protein [Roseomonas acroporae]